MRRITVHAALIGALLLAFGAGSYAVAGGGGKKKVKSESMSGYLEAPSISTVASGKFEAKINDSADTITYKLKYRDLEGTVTQAHIHIGQRSVSGGISAWLCETAGTQSPSASTPTCPAPGGTVTGTITPAEVVGPAGPFPPGPGGQGIAPGEFEELVAAIRAGVTYANVHSTKFGPGEVRGQINSRGGDNDDDD